MRYPSVKTIKERLHWLDEDQAKKVRGFMDGTLNPDDNKDVQAWVAQCYYRPSRFERKIYALNSVADTHGVEAIHDSEGGVAAEYLNTGDPYCPTVLYSYIHGSWMITSMGDFIETQERRGHKFP